MKSIKISIPKPCHEDWAKMTQEAKGKFCGSCEKVVYDMSVMTDNEIIKLVDSGKKVCGRFRNDQLNRSISATIPFRAKKTNWAIAASLLVGISLLSSCSTPPIDEPLVGELETIDQVDSIKTSCQNKDSLIKKLGELEVVLDSVLKTGLTVKNIGDVQEELNEIMTSGDVYVEPDIAPIMHTAGVPKIIEEPKPELTPKHRDSI